MTTTLTRTSDLAAALMDAVFRRYDVEAAAALLAPDYLQHNAVIPTGAQAILDVIPALEQAGTTVTTHRLIAAGDLVVAHNTYTNADIFGAPTMVAFDVLRIVDGRIVEHWDNLQPEPASTASGRSMTDGPTTPTDLDATGANAALVRSFVEEVFIGGAVDRAGDYIVSEPGAYRQHNPLVADGLAAVGEAFAALAAAGNGFSFSRLHHLVAEGDFVFTMTEGRVGETPSAFFDLWRVAEGRIVEHWDVIEAIPEEMAHDNGKF